MDHRLICFNPSKCITSFIHEHRDCAVGLGRMPVLNSGSDLSTLASSCHTLPPSGIRLSTHITPFLPMGSVTQPASWALTSILS